MRLIIPANIERLAAYIFRFIDLVGGDRCPPELIASSLHIVTNYRRLEMAISY